MRKIGLKVYYCPDVEIIHHHGKSTGGNYNMYALQQKSRSLFIKKNKMYFLYLLFRFILQPLYDLSMVALYMLRLLGKRDKENLLFGIKRHLAALRWELFNVLKLG
jgi:GT2 family glycosyltransferase